MSSPPKAEPTTPDEVVEGEYVNVGRARSATATSTASRKEYETLEDFLKRDEYSADAKRDKFKNVQVQSLDNSYKFRKNDLSLQ
uniref:Uncharacterized protein n=1 Tax=Caenorhabditis tropicalis TaxID=1561998 RepID=A0A1I7V135_9PELO